MVAFAVAAVIGSRLAVIFLAGLDKGHKAQVVNIKIP